jgi:hypothetical protein
MNGSIKAALETGGRLPLRDLVALFRMKSSVLALGLVIIAVAGCATFDAGEMNAIRARGVPPAIVAKLERHRPLTPPEIIILSRRGVPNSYIERHLAVAGADYLVTRDDILRMRQSGVDAQVIDALLVECDRFARGYEEPRYGADSYGWENSFYVTPSVYYRCR